jgi:transposase-like protein
MSRISRYSPELRERAVRMVNENCQDYPSEWAAFTAISLHEARKSLYKRWRSEGFKDTVTDEGYSIFMRTSQTKNVRTTPEGANRSERTSGALQVPVRTRIGVTRQFV